ncbi:MAG: hypothetical protein A2745_02780 [Candidatus Harrisonbacteria bacterium RIFCSPHIGHO2_01_FULL_44_13]|uniref:HTH HARE-type domain-containing protein n=1 Tax=Candidatus Harrisonbacteria bacterium RIFCSPLOWO2_01_FULL_44_18 TaxID=1798407 RepID=A0A1G1ZP96_9BACT|nr:MAG: hypothetical protein A2745_02780 [Candidatus Harrisonbacteria bacterium RIFCSPHIGHO2_01_FULL_44_13]OGY65550.1 MAG: hypothetical protein A3A16_01655 [Candidatus Harrisonbacteria bacterium RIFCSPLOWO2_01_FULL_44_18]
MKNNNYNLNKIVGGVLAGLPSNQKEVLERRYGLNNKAEVTLAEVGEDFGVTRERIRQIEALALKGIKKNLAGNDVQQFGRLVTDRLKSVGGLMRDDDLVNKLQPVLVDAGSSDAVSRQARFVLEVTGAAKYSPAERNFYAHWYLNESDRRKARMYLDRLAVNLENNNRPPQDPTGLNYVAISKKFKFNAYGDFGLNSDSEVNPRGARDWAYLVLKKENRPLHFVKLSNKIGQLRKGVATHFQTVHNELIKDDRFVLVGRGTYGLREFGLLPGTAKEVLGHFLKKHGPLKSQEVIKLVTAERTFKENTLLFNLRDKKYFARLDDGRYTVREA